MAARSPGFRLATPAPAPVVVHGTTAKAAPPPAPGGARPSITHLEEQHLPLELFHLERLAELEALVGDRFRGWAATHDGRIAVDVVRPGYRVEDLRADGEGAGVARYYGETLHQAIGEALRGERGRRA